MDIERTVKKLLESKPGWKKKGRPRIRWIDDIELDLRNMGGKQVSNVGFGQNGRGICREVSQGQT